MLNSVRWIGLRSLMRNVHWLNALAAATSIVSFGAEQQQRREVDRVRDRHRRRPPRQRQVDLEDRGDRRQQQQRRGTATGCRRTPSGRTRPAAPAPSADDGADVDPRGERQGLHCRAGSDDQDARLRGGSPARVHTIVHRCRSSDVRAPDDVVPRRRVPSVAVPQTMLSQSAPPHVGAPDDVRRCRCPGAVARGRGRRSTTTAACAGRRPTRSSSRGAACPRRWDCLPASARCPR